MLAFWDLAQYDGPPTTVLNMHAHSHYCMLTFFASSVSHHDNRVLNKRLLCICTMCATAHVTSTCQRPPLQSIALSTCMDMCLLILAQDTEHIYECVSVQHIVSDLHIGTVSTYLHDDSYVVYQRLPSNRGLLYNIPDQNHAVCVLPITSL